MTSPAGQPAQPHVHANDAHPWQAYGRPHAIDRARPARSALQRLTAHARDVLMRMSPLHLRTRTGMVASLRTRTDLRVYERMFVESMYPLSMFPPMPWNSSPVVFDIGAHTGLFALHVMDYLPQGHVHAFEPHPDHLKRLREHKRINGLDAMSIVAAAVSTDNASVDLHCTRSPLGATMIASKSLHLGRRSTMRVRGIALDTYIEEHGIRTIDLMKFDVEGAEVAVLAASPRTFAVVQRLFIRVFPPYSTIETTTSQLAAYGLVLTRAVPGGQHEYAFHREHLIDPHL